MAAKAASTLEGMRFNTDWREVESAWEWLRTSWFIAVLEKRMQRFRTVYRERSEAADSPAATRQLMPFRGERL